MWTIKICLHQLYLCNGWRYVVTSIVSGAINLGGRSVWHTGDGRRSRVYHTDRLHLCTTRSAWGTRSAGLSAAAETCRYAQLYVVNGACWIMNTIRYDTIDLRALKSWRDGQLNLPHSTKTKNKGKLKQKPINSEEMVRAIVREGSPGGRSETTKVGFVKQVGCDRRLFVCVFVCLSVNNATQTVIFVNLRVCYRLLTREELM